MIPAENKVDIIQTGMSFMRAITEAYGTDEGMKLWDTIANTLDPDIKGQIFFAMLKGEYTNIITITGYSPSANKITLIKAMRNVAGYGLKKAKDYCDLLSIGKTLRIEVNPELRTIGLHELRNAGFYV